MSNRYDWESIATVCVLCLVACLYMYLLLSPTQPRVPGQSNFVITRDTQSHFDKRMASSSQGNENFGYNDVWSKEWGAGDQKSQFTDDFLMSAGEREWEGSEWNLEGLGGGGGGGEEEESLEPIVPSKNYYCPADEASSQNTLIAMRSEMNYKYLWMHGNEKMWMSATGTLDTPIHRKSFHVHAVNHCTDGGWVLLQERDTKKFTMMVKPGDLTNYIDDSWVVKVGTESITEAISDPQYHWFLENEGYVLNNATNGFLTVMPMADYAVRGHSGGWNTNRPATREYGSSLQFLMVNSSEVEASVRKEEDEIEIAAEEDRKRLLIIANYPTSPEIRVIAYGLYGNKPKYTQGAIRNAEIVGTYFPGWKCRFYITPDVDAAVVNKLKELNSEIIPIPAGMGYASGMFWRFMVGADSTVDRYIVRDVDSRLNSRERMAVEEWIESKYPIHIIRDHVNHCIVMNGGMWGGVKDAIPNIKEMVENWSARDEYTADLHFLEEMIWPLVQENQIAHDSYCCDRFPNARPFPSQRDPTYQHVGQVFDEFDNPRLSDIDGFIRGVPIPGSCRKHADWIYG